ncbi:MAG: ADP-ribosylglycohydrolase family protein [Actinomycetota bacterium]|nr:ADP-ribosylglycohydrolase family protein [Actinomycetota bacterium]
MTTNSAAHRSQRHDREEFGGSPAAVMPRTHRAAGAVIGCAVGDALGAPFEFGPAGAYGDRFPDDARGVRTEMCGGGSRGLAPGEFTDDTQMALLLASSLVESGGLDEADVFERFRNWVAAGPPDVGNQTRAVLTSGRPFDVAAAEHFASTGHAAGNGSLMRTTPAAVWFAPAGREATMDAARRISALTHGDPAAGEGCAIFHELVRVGLDGSDPLAALPDALAAVAPAHRPKWESVLAPTWHPSDATESNGAVWPTLGSAVWALRQAKSFADGMRLVLDLGGDTDTVAAVTGGLLGAVFGIARIPMRWTSVLNGVVPGYADRPWHLMRLQHLAQLLCGDIRAWPFELDPDGVGIEPAEVFDGIWASDVFGARDSDRTFALISMCRTGGRFGHDIQRFAYLIDDDTNSELATVLEDILDDMQALRADGQRVLVHCYAGQSRTGLVLRAWLMRTQGVGVDEATERVRALWPHLNLWNDSFGTALSALALRASG